MVQTVFDPSLENTHYKAKNFGEHVHIQPGAAVGPKNGLSILLDTETFDYSFHLRASEGFKVRLYSVIHCLVFTASLICCI